jgi:hypothetical protein
MKRRAVESFRTAAEAIGPIQPEMSLFAITRGQFSLIDAILHTMQQIGPSHVSVWTWVIAEYEVDALNSLLIRQELLSGRLVIDVTASKPTMKRQPVVEDWRRKFGQDSVRICKNHAKIARVWNDQFRVLIRGSMNLNFNPRFENMDVTEGGEDFDLVERIESELPVLPGRPSNGDADRASGLGKAWEASQLEMFAGLRPWEK